jgi:putative addiction module component (TIGR02574 family)
MAHQALRSAALALPPDERAALAAELLESLDGDEADEGAAEAWEAEIARRLGEIERGEVTLVSAAEVLPLRGFPFTLVYRIHDNTPIIVALAHQKRRPDYWYDRQSWQGAETRTTSRMESAGKTLNNRSEGPCSRAGISHCVAVSVAVGQAPASRSI